MQKWEYLREAMGADDLKARGEEGWELVGAIGTGGTGLLFYKRPLVDEDVADTDATPTIWHRIHDRLAGIERHVVAAAHAEPPPPIPMAGAGYKEPPAPDLTPTAADDAEMQVREEQDQPEAGSQGPRPEAALEGHAGDSADRSGIAEAFVAKQDAGTIGGEHAVEHGETA